MSVISINHGKRESHPFLFIPSRKIFKILLFQKILVSKITFSSDKQQNVITKFTPEEFCRETTES